MDNYEELKEKVDLLRIQVNDLSHAVSLLTGKVEMMINSNAQMKMLLQYVVTPLLVMLGGLIGLKLALPNF
jgi:hypothetical protein